jgi:hypothetical protein
VRIVLYLNDRNEIPPYCVGHEMEMQQPEGLAPVTPIMAQESDGKPWGLMTGVNRWTYVWHVAVMLCTFGFVFPNAIIS